MFSYVHLAGCDAAFARGVLGRQPERVPAHRVHHRMAARPLVPGHDIAQGVVADMAHVDLAAGIGKHLQHVVFRLAVRRHVCHAEAAAVGPCPLPFRFGGGEIVARARFWCRGLLPRRGGGRVVHGRMYRSRTLVAQVLCRRRQAFQSRVVFSPPRSVPAIRLAPATEAAIHPTDARPARTRSPARHSRALVGKPLSDPLMTALPPAETASGRRHPRSATDPG